jgi:hypothetical protein
VSLCLSFIGQSFKPFILSLISFIAIGISGLHVSIRPPAFDRSRHLTRHVGLQETQALLLWPKLPLCFLIPTLKSLFEKKKRLSSPAQRLITDGIQRHRLLLISFRVFLLYFEKAKI